MRFYTLRRDSDYDDAMEVFDEEELIKWCPIYGRQHPGITKMKEGEEAILTVELPSTIGDFIATFPQKWIITDKVAELFQEQGFSGYELRPLRIKKIKRVRKSITIPKLWHFVVTGFAGMSPPESGIKFTYMCKACNLIEYSGCTNKSAIIDPLQWNGSDFFLVYPMTNFIIITERVKDFIENAGLTGCKIICPEEIKYIEDWLAGGRLHVDLPLEKAKAFGEPLGIYVDPEKLWERAIELGEEQIWPDGLGSRDYEWDMEWRNFLFSYWDEKKGVLSKEVLLEQLENMLKKYTHPQAIKDIKEKIDEIKKINF